MTSFRDQLVAVIGAAATGRAAAPVLANLGARVRVYDARQAADLGSAVEELALHAELLLGDPSFPGIEQCDLIIPSPGVPADHPVLRAAVERGTPVLSEIEVAGAISRAPIVAVTGTNGKTTTVFMAAAILAAAGRHVQVAGNALAGGYQVPLIRAAESAAADSWITAEVSSFQLEWVRDFRPRVAVITNITSDHMDRHKTREAYIAAKANLLRAQSTGDWTVLNLENDATLSLMAAARGRLLRFGRAPHPYEGAYVEGEGTSRRLMVRLDGAELPVMPVADLPLPGEHNLENALAACCVGLAAGCEPSTMATALREFRGVADRLEPAGTHNGVNYVNNTMCTNVDAAVRSIEAYDRPVVAICGGRDKGSDFAPLGACLAERARGLVAIGTDGPRIAAAAREHGMEECRIRVASSMAEAVESAAALAHPGDVVLLAPACASFDWYSSFEQRGRDFKACVAALMDGG